MTHWTGAKHRLNRDLGKYGNEAYNIEEMVAEFAAAFTCAEFGSDHVAVAAACIDEYYVEPPDGDYEALLWATAAAASRAVEYLSGLALAG